MYYDQIDFELIVVDIENGKNNTKKSIMAFRNQFEDYFEFLEQKDKDGYDNFKKLFEFAKIRYDNENSTFEQLINQDNCRFKEFYSHNKEHLEKWNHAFCEYFIKFYQHLHQLPINLSGKTNFRESIIPNYFMPEIHDDIVNYLKKKFSREF